MGDDPTLRREIIALSGKTHPSVLYLGTASFEKERNYLHQAGEFASSEGLDVSKLELAWEAPPRDEIEAMISAADIILCSGGNTKFAIRKWKELGVDAFLVSEGVSREGRRQVRPGGGEVRGGGGRVSE